MAKAGNPLVHKRREDKGELSEVGKVLRPGGIDAHHAAVPELSPRPPRRGPGRPGADRAEKGPRDANRVAGGARARGKEGGGGAPGGDRVSVEDGRARHPVFLPLLLDEGAGVEARGLGLLHAIRPLEPPHRVVVHRGGEGGLGQDVGLCGPLVVGDAPPPDAWGARLGPVHRVAVPHAQARLARDLGLLREVQVLHPAPVRGPVVRPVGEVVLGLPGEVARGAREHLRRVELEAVSVPTFQLDALLFEFVFEDDAREPLALGLEFGDLVLAVVLLLLDPLQLALALLVLLLQELVPRLRVAQVLLLGLELVLGLGPLLLGVLEVGRHVQHLLLHLHRLGHHVVDHLRAQVARRVLARLGRLDHLAVRVPVHLALPGDVRVVPPGAELDDELHIVNLNVGEGRVRGLFIFNFFRSLIALTSPFFLFSFLPFQVYFNRHFASKA
mmetsp:Transcript_794/g.1721  ORF Transcript_794/g.1721 Transcript_794/m.1721 type:complete len:443 (-) Transcript_794:180-1508(-)